MVMNQRVDAVGETIVIDETKNGPFQLKVRTGSATFIADEPIGIGGARVRSQPIRLVECGPWDLLGDDDAFVCVAQEVATGADSGEGDASPKWVGRGGHLQPRNTASGELKRRAATETSRNRLKLPCVQDD